MTFIGLGKLDLLFKQLLMDTYEKNSGKSSLFDEILYIDFYGSPTEAVCKLEGIRKWFISSLVYFDIEKNRRIFTVLEIQDHLI